MLFTHDIVQVGRSPEKDNVRLKERREAFESKGL